MQGTDKSPMQQSMPQMDQLDGGKNLEDHPKRRLILDKRAQMSGHLPHTHGKAPMDDGSHANTRKDGTAKLLEGSPPMRKPGRPTPQGSALNQLMAQAKASRQLNRAIGRTTAQTTAQATMHGKKRHATPLQHAQTTGSGQQQLASQRGGAGLQALAASTAAGNLNNSDLYGPVHYPLGLTK